MGCTADQLANGALGLVKIGVAALGWIADQCPAGLGAAAAQRAPLHRGDVLHLVHQNVAVDVLGVCVGVHFVTPIGQSFGGGDELGNVVAAVDEQHLAGIRLLGLRAHHGHQFVQQRHVADRPAGAGVP